MFTGLNRTCPGGEGICRDGGDMAGLKRAGVVGPLVLTLFASLFVTASGAAAVGGSITRVTSFNDARGDWPARPWTRPEA